MVRRLTRLFLFTLLLFLGCRSYDGVVNPDSEQETFRPNLRCDMVFADHSGGIPTGLTEVFGEDEAFQLILHSEVLSTYAVGDGFFYPDTPVAAALLLENPKTALHSAKKLLTESKSVVGEIYAVAMLSRILGRKDFPGIENKNIPIYVKYGCSERIMSPKEILGNKELFNMLIYPRKEIPKDRIRHYSLFDKTREEMQKWWREKDSLLFDPKFDIDAATNILSKSDCLYSNRGLSLESFAFEAVCRLADTNRQSEIGFSLTEQSPLGAKLYGLALLYASGDWLVYADARESLRDVLPKRLTWKSPSFFEKHGKQILDVNTSEGTMADFIVGLECYGLTRELSAEVPRQLAIREELEYMSRLLEEFRNQRTIKVSKTCDERGTLLE